MRWGEDRTACHALPAITRREYGPSGGRCHGVRVARSPNKNPASRRGSSFLGGESLEAPKNFLRGDARLVVGRLAQHVAAAPHRLDVVLAVAGIRELLAQLADEDVYDLELGLVHAAVEMIEEHLLGQRGALAEREQLQHLVFLAGEVHARAVHFHRLGVEIDYEVAGLDHRLRMALGAAHDGVDARDQLVLVEWLGHVVVGAEAETADLVLDAGQAGEDENGRLDLGDAKRAEHLEARHVRQVQVEQDDVVVVKLAEIDTFFAQIGGVDVEALGLQHQLNRLSSGAVVLNQQYAHASPLPRRVGLRSARRSGGPRKRIGTNPGRNLNDAWLTKPNPTCTCPLGKPGRIALRYCTGVVFLPSLISSSTLRFGGNRFRRLCTFVTSGGRAP